MKEFINIGKIVNTHGIKGEIKVYSLSEDENRFKKLKKFYIDGVLMNVEAIKLQPDRIIMKLQGINSIEEAMGYKNKYIQVKRDDAIKLPEGRYFVTDLIGCKVQSEQGVIHGDIFDIIFTGSNDVYWIKDNEKNTELLVPALEDIVLSIDVINKIVIIKDLEFWM